MVLENCKEPERKRIDTHIARAINPNRVFEPVFEKKRKEVCSTTDPNRVIQSLFIQKKDKRCLNSFVVKSVYIRTFFSAYAIIT